jgi:hypothetical protein
MAIYQPMPETETRDAPREAFAPLHRSARTSPPSSSEILSQADLIIHGERAESYGPAEDSFARIAALWTVHLSNKLPEGKVLDAYDVAVMMTLMKCARAQTDVKRDTFVDIAGYAALSERCAAKAGRV